MTNQDFIEIPLSSKVLTVDDLKAIGRDGAVVKPVDVKQYFNHRLNRYGIAIVFEPELNGKNEVRTTSRRIMSKLCQLGIAKLENNKLIIDKRKLLNNYHIRIAINPSSREPPLLLDFIPVNEVKIEINEEEQKVERVQLSNTQNLDFEKLKELVKKLDEVKNKVINFVADVQTRTEFSEIVYELKKFVGVEYGD